MQRDPIYELAPEHEISLRYENATGDFVVDLGVIGYDLYETFGDAYFGAFEWLEMKPEPLEQKMAINMPQYGARKLYLEVRSVFEALYAMKMDRATREQLVWGAVKFYAADPRVAKVVKKFARFASHDEHNCLISSTIHLHIVRIKTVMRAKGQNCPVDIESVMPIDPLSKSAYINNPLYGLF